MPKTEIFHQRKLDTPTKPSIENKFPKQIHKWTESVKTNAQTKNKVERRTETQI